ncbi:GNAT family N-acetyltransferase [Thermoflavimicrobium daqui]|uniref:GNAT family N-acetyltransferase n=1 Tax=Thermoflavimicrobium daqui TaxID=2137476 RepID=A0A364K599_9BACL|nr:GNAT family N-acetyltransferase [Thermoflavimicrobium daqui]RAL24439.1 GNAT family N-acetyltransferase [Thermoflavimicrobium daqui]
MTVLLTPRMKLRPFRLEDAPEVKQLAGIWDVANTTARIPYPYPDGEAERWIQSLEESDNYTFAMVSQADEHLIGSISLTIRNHGIAELGYWIGKPFWGNRYATEAAHEILRFGFEDLKLHRIEAQALSRNTGSLRVLEKVGFLQEGLLRDYHYRFEKYEDIIQFGLLAWEWKLKKHSS